MDFETFCRVAMDEFEKLKNDDSQDSAIVICHRDKKMSDYIIRSRVKTDTTGMGDILVSNAIALLIYQIKPPGNGKCKNSMITTNGVTTIETESGTISYMVYSQTQVVDKESARISLAINTRISDFIRRKGRK